MSPSDILAKYSYHEILLWAAFLSREPSPEEKTEYGLAYLCAHIAASNGKKNARLQDFLVFKDPWKDEGRRDRDRTKVTTEGLISAFKAAGHEVIVADPYEPGSQGTYLDGK